MELKSDYKVFASGILGEGDYAINCYSTGNINITAGYKYSYSVVATGIALGYNSAPDIQSCFTDLCIVVKNSNGDSYIICRVSLRCDEFINNYYSLEQYCTFNDVFAECEDEGNLSCVERKDVDSTFFTDELGWSTEVWDFSNEYPTLKD
jgi:hypothetical protein